MFRTTLIAAALLWLAACNYVPDGIEPIVGFDAQRYMGRWHEIARLPNRFEAGLEMVTAMYELRDDGTVEVVNRGYDTGNGEWREARGTARFIGSPDVASLKVSFFGPFHGGYNVVDLDPAYTLSMVVGSNRSYLWILSRTGNPPPEAVERLVAKVAALGFDTQSLIYVRH